MIPTASDAHSREPILTPQTMIADLERYRIIDKKELRKYVPYSGQHILRLECARAFPARIRLGENRVGWLLGEVLDWIEARKHARAGYKSPAPKQLRLPIPDAELERILVKKELRRFVPYTAQHIARLESAGAFPARLPVGGNRVGWVLGELLTWIADRVRERDARLRAEAASIADQK